MKKLCFISVICFMIFEIANVYFIMPMPGGSQEIQSIGLAYFLHSWRWIFRCLFALGIVLTAHQCFKKIPLWSVLALVMLFATIYATNFYMAADAMFKQVNTLTFKDVQANTVENEKLVIGITHDGHAKAYPIQYLGYHHQVRDSIGDKPVMITYCTVCRTGRVFEPLVDGKMEEFRLVGMDHYNAMFEDKSTKSWWRQSTGEAVAGKSKGETLPEFPSVQTTLNKWVEMYPQTLIMQPDTIFKVKYDSLRTYERGKLTGRLTRRDTASWQAKSWIIGVQLGGYSKAYDWNLLQKEKIIYDNLGNTPIVVILSKDNFSFVALVRESPNQTFNLENDILKSGDRSFNFMGKDQSLYGTDLKRLNAYQEYWHSWQTFHPKTLK